MWRTRRTWRRAERPGAPSPPRPLPRHKPGGTNSETAFECDDVNPKLRPGPAQPSAPPSCPPPRPSRCPPPPPSWSASRAGVGPGPELETRQDGGAQSPGRAPAPPTPASPPSGPTVAGSGCLCKFKPSWFFCFHVSISNTD